MNEAPCTQLQHGCIPTAKIAWVLWALFAVRQFANAFLLEPTTDEGLWLWNAHVEHWHLPDFGMLHAALSPGNHWLARLLFLITGPSVVAMRLLNVLLLTSALGWWMSREQAAGRALTMLVATVFLLVDPFIFRAASWAYLEPKLLACLLVALGFFNHKPTWKTTAAMGLTLGVMLAIKATAAWIPALLMPWFLAKESRLHALAAWSTAALLAAACYVSVWLTHDQVRFAAVWHQHSVGRLGVMQGYATLFWQHDVRALAYMAVILSGVVASLHRLICRGHDSLAWACLAGAAYFGVQTYVQDRYLMPLAILCVIVLSIQFHGATYFSRMKSVLVVCVAILASVTLHYKLIAHPQNDGGWALHDLIGRAARMNLSIAAPPCLSIGIRHPVVPASVGEHMGSPPMGWVPDLLVLQDVAAEPTSEDARFLRSLEERGAQTVRVGHFYRAVSVERALLADWARDAVTVGINVSTSP